MLQFQSEMSPTVSHVEHFIPQLVFLFEEVIESLDGDLAGKVGGLEVL